MDKKDKKVLLMILDGWGKSPNPDVSAVERAKTPFIDGLYKKYPDANLKTFGTNVGLPEGQVGNSEVGHMNIGAGRIVYQDLARIDMAVEKDSLKDEKVLREGIAYAKRHDKNIHLLGLISDGGVHSHIDHLKEFVRILDRQDVNTFIHGFTDGRDTDPKSGKIFVEDLESFLKNKNAKLASLIGRYYAMDRDKRWERVQLAYNLLTKGEGVHSEDLTKSIQKSYDEGVTDEFVKPIVKTKKDVPIGVIQEGDVVIFFNFRTDRGRQLTEVLTQKDFLEYGMHKLHLRYITMTNYDESFENIQVIYDKDNIVDTLGEVLSVHNKKQIRIAETEKYPHVTFFFNGGRETPFEGEKRILCPSPKVATYDLQPEMAAVDIRDAIIPELEKEEADFVCLNFANPDMVGHTGIMEAAIKACETVDACAKDVIDTAGKHGYTTIVIADHGNCDTMSNPDGSPNTSHTANLVPIIVVDDDIKSVRSGVLGALAPTILKIMGIPKPEKMTEGSLI